MKKNPKSIADIACLTVVGLLYAAVVALNLFQGERPTFSESEKRELASFPSFSVSSLADGSFFSGISSFLSDTFCGREQLVTLSKKMETLTGFDNGLVVLHTGDQEEQTTDDLSELLEQLTSQSEEPATDPATEPPTDPVTDPATEPGTDPVTEPATDPDTDPVTEPPTDPDTDPVTDPVTEEPPTEAPLQYKNLALSHALISLLPGSSSKIAATVEVTGNGVQDPYVWYSEDPSIAEIQQNSSGVSVLAKAVGETRIVCTVGGLTATCQVKVTSGETKQSETKDYEFLSNGMFILGDAVYLTAGYGATGAQSYLQAVQYYQTLFPGTRITVMPIPVSSVVVDDPAITSRITNQGDSLAKMAALYQGTGINLVNVYDTFFAHRSEYLYLKTDHHWNGRGAYYAYSVFAPSVGLTPVPMSSLTYTVLNSKYHGSLYSFTQDPRVLQFSDVLEAFDPGVPCTMTITRTGGSTETYKSSIIPAYGNYLAYIGGDNPYTIINVPSNPQDKSILVLKDSYGNAIIPYLTLHYGNIIVIDPRYCGFNIYQQFKDYGLDDILFLNNMQCVNTSTWIRLYLALVGVS